jgi:UPF0755 protein
MRRRHLASSIFGDPAHDPADVDVQEDPAHDAAGMADVAPALDGDGPRRAQRVRLRSTRRLIVLLVTLGLVVGAGSVAFFSVRSWISGVTASNDYAGDGSGKVSVVVHSGDTSRTIGATLEKAGVVKTARAFGDAAADSSESGSIQPGTYALRTKMSAVSALAMMLDGDNRTVPRVTIREGLWTSEVIAALSAATGRPLTDYQTALKDPAALGLPAAAKGRAEGYLFPETYTFETNASAADQLHTMVAKTLEHLDSLGVSDDKMQRVLTIASIVEAEARAAPDRPKVARVIENRLAKAMRLEMDSTVHFVSQRRGKAGTTDAQRLSKSPYNTYLVAGLPPGPIDNPGLAAMTAAVSPAPGSWVYFVAVNPDTGETRFTVDEAGHAANTKLFQKWCSDHPGKC